MICSIVHLNKNLSFDLTKPYDISIPLAASKENLTAWYVDTPIIEPVKGDGFIGSVAEGGSVNFRNIQFNPHGHGTHTECVGHISPEVYSINKHLTHFHFIAIVLTVEPTLWKTNEGTRNKGDLIIELAHIKKAITTYNPQALVIRTSPNPKSKQHKQYSSTNPAYLCDEAARFITNNGIDHLLIDLPSVDKELDNGELKSHKAFWQYPGNIQLNKTITELIFVDDSIVDGLYLLNLQIAPFENDASPSKPVLYPLI